MPEQVIDTETADQYGTREYDDDNEQVNANDDDDDDEEDEEVGEDEQEYDDDRTPTFSDEEYNGDTSNEAICPDLMAECPRKHENLNNVIIVDNLPKVDPEKLTKLKGVIEKIYNRYGTFRRDYYAKDQTGLTKGYAFFEFENEQAANEAVRATDGYRLDKNHKLAVCLMSDYDRLTQNPPEPTEIGNLYSWLLEPNAVDQFAVHSEDPKRIAVYRNALSQPAIIQERNNWTEGSFVWSPKGTYLASFHEQGIALWGGETFKQVLRFAHRTVNYIKFSPNERYLITLSSRPNNAEAFIIWDVITGEKKRSFPLDAGAMIKSEYFKWSFQDHYFAKKGADGIYIYDTETFQLLDKKPFRIPLLANFEWSTSDNRLAYWTTEEGNIPARLVLAEIVGGNRLEEVRSKTLFNVIECELRWQTRGDYLVVKVDRYGKKSGEKNAIKHSGLIYNFEIFHIREKNIPLDTLEVKEPIQSFAVEPNGHKLIVISGEQSKTVVTFYRMGQGQKSGKIETLKVLSLPVNNAYWSPNGQHVVLAATKTSSVSGGLLVFVDSSDISIMTKQEHPDLSKVEWDPTGRYVTSYVPLHDAKRDHSFKIWTFQGTRVFEKNVERLLAFHWRPRPPSLLTEEMIREVRRNRSTWTSKFDNQDRNSRIVISEKQREQRQAALAAFQKIRDEQHQRLATQKAARIQLRGGKDTDNLFDQQSSNVREETVEFLIKSEEVEYKA